MKLKLSCEKSRLGAALVLTMVWGLAKAADWQTFEQSSSSTTEYMVGATSRKTEGLVSIEYKRLAFQLRPDGLIVMDQFVVSCHDDKSKNLFALLKLHSSVSKNQEPKPRLLSAQAFDPPQMVPDTDKPAIELAQKICKEESS